MTLSSLGQVWKVPTLRRKILVVLGLLAIFRILAVIPVPGVPRESLQSLFSGNQLFGLLDIFSGGGLSNLSIVMLGVGPYITASIVMQLLTMVVPRLEELKKEEGEAGQKKINQWTRMLSVPLAAVQAFGFLNLLQSGATGHQAAALSFSPWQLMVVLITVTAGTVFLMWLGELITEQGIGNGISLLIFVGIIARLPVVVSQLYASWTPDLLVPYIGFAAVAVATIAGVVFVTEGQRVIPISYARQVRGGRAVGGTSFLPLRVNQAGVIPIIFALSVMLFPGVVANFFVGVNNVTVANSAQWIVDLFQNQTFYGITYFVLVVAFTYFYTSVTFDPEQVAENLQRQGGFVPGMRPGSQTRKYLAFVVNRITLSGALFLGAVAVLPLILQAVTGITTLTIGGTALLIVVSVVLEIMKQLDSQLAMRQYG